MPTQEIGRSKAALVVQDTRSKIVLSAPVALTDSSVTPSRAKHSSSTLSYHFAPIPARVSAPPQLTQAGSRIPIGHANQLMQEGYKYMLDEQLAMV